MYNRNQSHSNWQFCVIISALSKKWLTAAHCGTLPRHSAHAKANHPLDSNMQPPSSIWIKTNNLSPSTIKQSKSLFRFWQWWMSHKVYVKESFSPPFLSKLNHASISHISSLCFWLLLWLLFIGYNNFSQALFKNHINILDMCGYRNLLHLSSGLSPDNLDQSA